MEPKDNIVAAVILAAGLGTRMRSNRAKVLHAIDGKPMILFVVETAAAVVGPDHVVVVVGHQAEEVRAVISEHYAVGFALQPKQRGTGDAVRCALDAIPQGADHIVILCGDVPRLKPVTIARLLDAHCQNANDITVLAVEVEQPDGYGRIISDAAGQVLGIIEEADASAAQRSIRLINSGIYCVEKDFLKRALEEIQPDNAQGEYYLTDIVAVAKANGRRVGLQIGSNADEVAGINTIDQLEAVATAMRDDGGKSA